MTIQPHHTDADGPSDSSDVGSDAAEEFVRSHPSVVSFARVGWAAKGVVYVLTGILAFTIALDSGNSEQSGGSEGQAAPSGAVATIAEQPFGTALLWAMAIGLFVYAAWRIVTVVLPADLDGHAILRRIGYSVSAATYIALGVTAVTLASRSGSSGSGGSSQDSQVASASTTVMEWPAGRWLVGVAGLVVIGIGVYFGYKAYSASFEKEIEHRSIGPLSWHTVRIMGRIGWVGRSVMMALIGVFVTRAAINFDPDEASGLDDSLRKVADDSFGTVLVLVVAVGLILYGAFCVITSPARKVVASDEDTVAS